MNSFSADNGSASQRPSRFSARIRELNDHLPQTGQGGRVVLTSGVAALSPEDRATVFEAVRDYDDFDPNNDPHGEHDFGLIVIPGPCFVFKIDYYDLVMAAHSPDPADPAVTCRVLTVVLKEEC